MMQTPAADTGSVLALSRPDALVAALPYLLGFRPAESAIVLWLSARRLMLTQRVDLPPSAADVATWLGQVWAHVATRTCDEIVVVVVSDRPDAPDLADAIVRRAVDAEFGVRDSLLVGEDGRWRSLLCSDPECCVPVLRPVDPAVADLVRAEFAGAGVAPVADRAELEREISPYRASGRAPRRLRRRGEDVETWRDRMIAEIMARIGDPGEVDASEESADRLAAALCDVRVRDTVLWELARIDPDGLHRGLHRLIGMLQCATSGRVAPVATCVAVTAWLVGDGARAQIALEQALADDEDYSLAHLVGQSVRAGLPPMAWREVMATLTREVCRHGSAGAAVHG